MKQNLLLIGYRGTGKSTVGKLLADRLGFPFVDADVLLEERAGATIRAIFAEEGEAGFRKRESAILREICQTDQQVIATGGGVILSEANRELIKKSGFVVWLSAEPDILAKRLNADPTTQERRPKLAQGGLDEIREVLERRIPLYRECADCEISATVSPSLLADTILSAWTAIISTSSNTPG